jgi:formylglycine-generating enzyme
MRYADGNKEEKSVEIPKNVRVPVLFAYVERPKESESVVFVKGGTFMMGSNDGEIDEKPIHEARVSDFMIGKLEVTQKEWVEIMGSNPSAFKGDTLPVEQVSWYDAVDYCDKRSVKEGLSPCYAIEGRNVTCDFAKNGYRLPTEAEWEFVARGGVSSKRFLYSGSDDIDSVAWYTSTTKNSGTKPEGTKAANELGVFDMSGNVWEWCWDFSGAYPGGPQVDPRGPASGWNRVGRGGSWYNGAAYERVAEHNNFVPTSSGNGIGFRVARSLSNR